VISRIHSKLGTAGFIISIVALVAALGGGAYAASGGLNGKQKKEVEKIAKKYAGKPGATGPAGPAGSAGGKGDNGAPGAAGKDGAEGKVGPTGPQGPQGAQGVQGVQGPAGMLPSGAIALQPGQTETGIWNATPAVGGSTTLITYPLQLAAEPEVVIVREGDTAPTECAGGTAAEPKAEPGNLCVYVTFEEELETITDNTWAPQQGMRLNLGFGGTNGGANAVVIGTWAVSE
jgi:hypothetical protein